MSLRNTIVKMVNFADQFTTKQGLQDWIQHYPWISDDDFGQPVFGTAVPRLAIIEEKEYLRRLSSGQEVLQKAELTILRPIKNNGAEGRREPLDPRDKIVLPSGFTGPILNADGLVDPVTHNPYMFTIILG